MKSKKEIEKHLENQRWCSERREFDMGGDGTTISSIIFSLNFYFII